MRAKLDEFTELPKYKSSIMMDKFRDKFSKSY